MTIGHRCNYRELIPGRYRYACICGWSSEVCHTREDARAAFTEHAPEVDGDGVTQVRLITTEMSADGVRTLHDGPATRIQLGPDIQVVR